MKETKTKMREFASIHCRYFSSAGRINLPRKCACCSAESSA